MECFEGRQLFNLYRCGHSVRTPQLAPAFIKLFAVGGLLKMVLSSALRHAGFANRGVVARERLFNNGLQQFDHSCKTRSDAV